MDAFHHSSDTDPLLVSWILPRMSGCCTAIQSFSHRAQTSLSPCRNEQVAARIQMGSGMPRCCSTVRVLRGGCDAGNGIVSAAALSPYINKPLTLLALTK